jgi:hypothetical protein
MSTICPSCGGWSRLAARPECTTAENHRSAGAAGRVLSLREECAYYEERAVDYTIPKRERDLWQQLADELNKRLGSNNDDPQPELW